MNPRQVLFDKLFEIIQCLPDEMIHIIVSYYQPTIGSLVEKRRKPNDTTCGPLFMRYKDDIYAFITSWDTDYNTKVTVCTQDGKTKRKFELDFNVSTHINIIKDEFIVWSADYGSIVLNMDGKYVRRFSTIAVGKIIVIPDNNYMAMDINGNHLYVLNSKGDILHEKTCDCRDILRYHQLNYIHDRSSITSYDDKCKLVHSFSVSKYCEEIHSVGIHQDMIYIWDTRPTYVYRVSDRIVDPYCTNEKGTVMRGRTIHIFDLHGNFLSQHDVCSSGTSFVTYRLESNGNDLWMYDDTGITVFDCKYKETA